MKTKLYSSKLLLPLAGSICGLLVVTLFTPLASVPSLHAAEPALTRAAKASKASNQQEAEPKGEPNRTPEEALASGLKYLLGQQHQDGGWGQGGGWRQNNRSNSGGGRVEGPNVEDPSDLGNTCVSLVTLLRAGETPAKGEHRQAAAKAFDFVCRQVEDADKKSLYVTDVRDTQLQVKIGTYVDTFLAGWVLSELKDNLPDDAAEKRRVAALDKVVGKIVHHQLDDGSFAGNNGWAAVLSQGLCSRALNEASRSGANVSKEALDKDQKQNLSGLDVAKGLFSAVPASPEPSSAGVSIYREASKLGGLIANSKLSAARKANAEKTLADTAAPTPMKQQAQQELKDIEANAKATEAASNAVAGNLRNSSYTAGFGNNGGEEYLSYMNVTEGIHARGGKDWEDWRSKMTRTVCGAQNADGSWAGQHCITGRTFCTATALLTLLVEKENPNAGLSDNNNGATAAPVAAK